MKTFKTYLFVLTLLISAPVFIACQNDDDTQPQPDPIVEASPVQIIASGQTSSDSPTGIWQDTIILDKSSLLTINATASARYSGNVVNAGIRLVIRLDGEEIASDYSFEGSSSSILFSSSASTTLFLQPGSYNLEIERVNAAVNSNYNIRANYYAIYAEMSN